MLLLRDNATLRSRKHEPSAGCPYGALLYTQISPMLKGLVETAGVLVGTSFTNRPLTGAHVTVATPPAMFPDVHCRTSV